MSDSIQLQEVNSARSGEIRLRPKPKNNNCTVAIIVLFTLFAIVILSIYSQSEQLLQRVNQVQGNITHHIPFHSGELHYSRIPWQYWEHRIKMVKGMGFNAVSVYVMWNFHEIEKGKFDFESKQKNLTKFLELAKQNDMKVLLRPGPYVCAEWDFGGLPARLLQDEQMVLRTHDPLYEAEVKVYISRLAEIIKPFLFKNGGNIILIQIENQLGSLNSDRLHTLGLLEMWKQLGVQSQFYHEDASWYWQKHYWGGAHVGLSQGKTLWDFVIVDISKRRQNTSLVFGGEIYTGWLTHWGETTRGRKEEEFTSHFELLIKANRSLSLYVAHGGSNFGLTAGANGFPNNDYMPHITSYDYDAPINENGAPTSKYFQIRTIMKEHLQHELPLIPIGIKTISLKPFKPNSIQGNLFANINEPQLRDSDLVYFESSALKMFNQGMVLYQTDLLSQKTYFFNSTFRDFLMIYVDDNFQWNLTRSRLPFQTFNVTCLKQSCRLRLLVEAMGHINYGIKQMTDRKGLLQCDQIDPNTKTIIKNDYKWNIYKVPITETILEWNLKHDKLRYPALLSGTFEISSVGDTYIDMINYKKGYLWVNDYLLGRYWDRGPQRRLYCPGVWLHNGQNQFKILELLDDEMNQLAGYNHKLPEEIF